jgi:hypothetical protein
MTTVKRPWYRRPGFQIGIVLTLLVILGGGATIILTSQTVPAQPIAFPHSVHVGLGAPCAYCHPGAATGPVAGLPTASKCWGCHQQVPKTATSPELAKLVTFIKNKQSIPWVPVAIQPDFVRFNHRPHIAAGVECKTCHGDLAKMKTAQPQAGQNMGWCLDCHKRMKPDEFVRLSDCATCHY